MEKQMIRVGVIGACGNIGTTHMENLVNYVHGAKVTVVYDIDEEKVKQVKMRFDVESAKSAEELIQREDVDAVLIASWDGTHAKYVMACMQAGKPVFCEKPLATTLEDAKMVLAEEQKSKGNMLQIGFMRRFDPDYLKIKKILDSGELGAPLMMHCISRTREHPKSHTTKQHITNIAIHEIDICRWLLGEEISEVAVRFPRSTSYAEGTCKDPQLILMQSESGVLIDVEVSANSYYGYEILCELVCEKGTVRLPVAAEPIVRSYLQCASAIPADWTMRFVEAYRNELQYWIDTLLEREDKTGPGTKDGYAACLVADALMHAQDSGMWEKV